MEAILYAEIYCICIIITGILFIWTRQNGMQSFSELCLSRLLLCFLINFTSNFLFTLVNRILDLESAATWSYLFKTLYHITLILGVFIWCIYAESKTKDHLPAKKNSWWLILSPAVIPVVMALVNLYTHKLFYLDAAGNYIRASWFQFEMFYLLVFSVIFAVRLFLHSSGESEPGAKTLLYIACTFPICILASWALSFVGEAFPVICVMLTIELLLLSLGTIMQAISVDKLTQVNNRQNLIGFINYKLKNHDHDVYLLMLDMDNFKTINDTYGHDTGAALLKKVAGVIRSSFRSEDFVFRVGGDEFAVIMVHASWEQKALLEQKLNACNEMLNNPDDGLPKTSLSIGVAFQDSSREDQDMYKDADLALYKTKERGRNGCTFFGDQES